MPPNLYTVHQHFMINTNENSLGNDRTNHSQDCQLQKTKLFAPTVSVLGVHCTVSLLYTTHRSHRRSCLGPESTHFNKPCSVYDKVDDPVSLLYIFVFPFDRNSVLDFRQVYLFSREKIFQTMNKLPFHDKNQLHVSIVHIFIKFVAY